MKKRILFIITLLYATLSCWAISVTVSSLGASSGWYSDDTRNTSGTVLNGLVSSYPPYFGYVPGTTADDAAIALQIKFGDFYTGSSYGVLQLDGTTANTGKSSVKYYNLSVPGSALATFTSTFRWYMDPYTTSRTPALSLMVLGSNSLIYSLAYVGEGAVMSNWNTFYVDATTTPSLSGYGWFVYGSGAPGGSLSQSLNAWLADPTWGPILSGGTIIAQGFNIGSYQRNCRVGIDWLQSNILNGGNQIDFVSPIHNVTQNTYYNTIQAAINSANANDVIEVAAGTYSGNIVINKNISLFSTSGAASTILDGNNAGSELATIQLTSGRNGVIIGSIGKGFTIKGIDGTPGLEKAAIYLQGTQDNITIEDNILECRGDAALLGEYNAANNHIVINSNQFTGQTFIGANPAGVGFAAQFTLPNVPRQVVVFGGGSGTTNTKNFTFTNNIISAISGGMSITDNSGLPIPPTPQGNTMVTLDLVGANTITGNDISGTTTRYAEALRVRGTGTYTITSNNFTGSYPYNITRVGTTLAANCNWWGSTDPAVITSKINGSVTFIPYSMSPGGVCAGGLPVQLWRSGVLISGHATIQTAIDAAAIAGDVIKVFPGTYNQDEANGYNPVTGGPGSSDFNIFVNKSVTIQGVDASGVPITNYNNVAAFVIPKRDTPISNLSTFFVQADNVTITGMDITAFNDPDYNFKTISIIGNNCSIKYCKLHNLDQVSSIYMYDPRYVPDVSYLQSYDFEYNYFDAGGIYASGIRMSSGTGWTGPVANRVISGNTFSLGSYGIEFVGPNVDGWDYYPVGAATITSNTFTGQDKGSLVAWGKYAGVDGYGPIAWDAVFAGNTFDKAVLVKTPGGQVRYYDQGSFYNLRGIYSAIQRYPLDKVAQAGDFVNVKAGTYTEQVHVILNNLTIQGSGKANTFIKSPASLALSFNGKKPVVFVDGVASCTMNDLTVDGDGKGNANYSFLGVAFWNAGGTLSNVDVLNVRDTPFSGAQHGVGVYAYNNITGSYLVNINDVTVTNFQKNAFALSGDGLTVNLDGVIVTGAGSTSVTAQNGIQVGFGASGTIANSSVTGIHYMDNVPPLDATATGVLLYDAGTVDMDNVQVTNSQTAVYFIDTYGSFNNSSVTLPVADVWADGVDIYFTSAKKGLTSDKHNHSQPFLEQYSGKPYLAKAITTIAIDNTTLTGNNYTGNMGISVYAEGNVDLTVTNSDVTNWDYGVNETEDGGTITSAVNQNDLSSNNLAFWTNAAAYQDATCNYYGTTDPLVVQSKIEGNVTFLPFWTTSTGPCDGLGPVVNVTQSKSYMNIKPAVLEAVDNDFIEVAEGTYTESGQINIDKNLTITGANKATTIIKPAASFAEANYKDDASAWFLVNSGKTFNLSNVTLDGTGKLVCNAILSHGHGTIDNNIIKNIEHDQSTHYDGAGVALYSSDMTVSNNTLSGIGREGIFAAFFSTATITGNTYTGKGSGNWLDYGIEVGRNSTATISGNTISGNIGVATDLSTSAGILVTSYYDLAGVSTGATISNNSITGNYQGIAVGYDASDVSIVTATHNKIYGNTDYGVFSTGVTVDATLNWWGKVTGPTHATNQCGTGDAITDHVTYSPWYTNEGMTTTNTANVHKLSGTVKYANNAGTPLNGIRVTLKNSINEEQYYNTNSTPGYYEFNGLTNDTYSIELSSVNSSGNPQPWQTWGGVNNTDYLLVLKHTIPPGPYLPIEPPVIRIAADVKSPAYPAPPIINGADATAIKNAAKYGWFMPSSTTPWFDTPRWVFSGSHSSAPLTGIVLNCANVNTEIKRSIVGLCAGDVNASYLPPSGPKSAQPNLDLVNRGSIAAANEITIPVRADMDMELGAITLFLDYDASMLEITGVTMPKQGNDAPYFLAGNNMIQIGWVSLEPVNVAMGETVLVIHGKVKNSNPGMIRFTLNSNPLSELANGEGVVIPGRLAIADIGGTASNDMISVYPNPAKDVLNIEYLMDETGTFRAELRNAQGVIVGTINNTSKPAGSHQEKLNVSNLPSGVYMLRVFRGSNINTQKIIINR